jgi:hypothetical protein
MTKSITRHWFPIQAISLLFLLATLPLYGEDPAPATPAETPPAEELQAGAQPTATPVAPGQNHACPARTDGADNSLDFSRKRCGTIFGRFAGSVGSRLAVLTQEPSWQAYAMNQAFSQLDKRQLNNIRTFRAENIAPVTLHRTD